MAPSLATRVAAARRSRVEGYFERHVSKAVRETTGTNAGGRWGPVGGYLVLYLGRPRNSVVVEAYRHLVDPFVTDGMTGDMVVARRLLICEVNVGEILDLRTQEVALQVGLSEVDLMSPIGWYDNCLEVGLVAHQLGLRGIIAPSASGFGETLALFQEHVPAEEWPVVVAEEPWNRLPSDPRELGIRPDRPTGTSLN